MPLPPRAANHVWAYDFVFDSCANGQQLKCLTVVDEWTREALAIDVAGSIRSGRVIEVLSEHMCQGLLEGYLLTGRHGFFSTYESFAHVIDSFLLERHVEITIWFWIAFNAFDTAANPGRAAMTAPKPYSDAVFIDARSEPATAASWNSRHGSHHVAPT